MDYFSLEENRLYDYLWENGYGISTYAMPGFNTCIKGGSLNTDRCVIKSYKTVPVYDKNRTVEQNVYALLTEWILSLKSRDLKSVAKMLAGMSPLKGIKVTAENRRVSLEGAPAVVDEAGEDFSRDKAGQVYMIYVDLPSDIYMYDEFCNLKPRKEWVALKDNSLANGGIDEKRKAYADQAKCAIGKLQEYMDIVAESYKNAKTDIIIQGVSTIRELAGMTGGRYGNFVKDQLVNLAIRKGKRPKFLINANICLASDFTKTLIRYQDYCYSIDNMNLKTDEALSLKQNLINNSVIRGSKISNIAANYQDWYAEYKQKSRAYQEKLRKDDLILEMDDNGEIRSFNPGSSGISGTDAPEEDAASEAEAVPGDTAVPGAENATGAVVVPGVENVSGVNVAPGADVVSEDTVVPGAGDVQKMNEASEAATVPESGNVAE